MRMGATALAGVRVVESMPVQDDRGAFARFFCSHELGVLMGERRIVQINHSVTRSGGAIRGLHFQYAPHCEMKLIRCLRGRVWDVALDLRAGSPTLLRWHAEELSAKNGRMLVIPEGCAHGFQVLEPDSEMLYLHTAYYAPEAEAGVRFDDPAVGIPWPLPATDVSVRDRALTALPPGFQGLAI